MKIILELLPGLLIHLIKISLPLKPNTPIESEQIMAINPIYYPIKYHL